MKFYRYKVLLYVWAVLACCPACSGSNEEEPITPPQPTVSVMADLWATSPFELTAARRTAFNVIQNYANQCSNTMFKSYLTSTESVASSLESSIEIIHCYNQAFNRVLDGLKNDKPADGEAHIWMLYNMGYIVKTPKGAFAIDIMHRRAVELAPFLNFYAMSHIHQDHKSEALADAMVRAGKPVLSNFYVTQTANDQYVSNTNKDYTIGAFQIHSFVTDHNNGTTNVPVTVFKVDCGISGGNLVLMHSGDSNFQPSQFASVKNAEIDVYVSRYAPNALTENNVIGSVFSPRYVLLSHILELTHADPNSSRWTLEQGLERASKLNCSRALMPFWGEKMVWKNNQLAQIN